MRQTLSPENAPIKWRLYEFSGPDAADFLHRLASANIRTLKPTAGTPCAFLSAQGKFRAFFWLFRLASDRFLMEFDATESGIFETELQGFIDQMTFGEKLALKPLNTWTWTWELADGPAEISAQETETGFTLCHGSRTFGRKWTSHWSQAAEHTSASDKSLDWSTLTRLRTDALQPWPGVELTPETMPPEVGLPEVAARGKGCYPGQEVMEKIFSFGASPRRLCRIQDEGGQVHLALLRKADAVVGREVNFNNKKATVDACAPSTHE